MERVNFHLTDGERKGLELISEITGVKKAELIRRAIDEYIQRKRWEGITGISDLKEVYA
jgi:metal-responsive CopG/Arc/MetJ family transcriptional regulator